MEHKMFSDGELMKHGWAKFQENIPLLLGAVVLWGILSFLPLIFGIISREGWFLVLMFALSMFIATFIAIGFGRMVISIADNKKTEFSILFSGLDVFLSFVAVNILYVVIVMVGTLLFIIPGIIWGLQFMWAPMLVIDKKLSPMEALRKSSEMTQGLKWDLFGWQLLAGQVVGMAMYALLIPVLVALPIVMIGTARLYRQFAPKN